MDINGLPVHALVVHAAVVLGPLAALAGVLYGVVPKFRDWLRWPLVVTAALALVSIWVAYFSGERLTEVNQYGGPLTALVETHEERADILRISMTVFAVVTFVAAWLHTRQGVVRMLLGGGVAGLGVLTLVYVVLTGDAGAQIAWYGTTA